MTIQNVNVNIDNAVFQAAVNRATGEGKDIGQVVALFIELYAAGASAGAPTSYTVQRGDTLGRIAAQFYGNARKYPVIQRANNIANPSRIWVGQVLVIPPVVGTSPVPGQPAPPPSPISPAPAPILTPAPLSPPVTAPQPAPLPVEGTPSKLTLRWVGSPNFNNRRRPDDISAIVIHSTANSSLDRVIEWFNKPSAQVSAHYTIGKDGETVQHVQDMHRAWHAGRSIWKGRKSCNDYAIGIELVNLNDGVDPYPETQHQATVTLCTHLVNKYKISVDDIMGHLDIAIPPGRKSDPRGYNLDRLRNDVATKLGHR